jgi:hypothetical protein
MIGLALVRVRACSLRSRAPCGCRINRSAPELPNYFFQPPGSQTTDRRCSRQPLGKWPDPATPEGCRPNRPIATPPTRSKINCPSFCVQRRPYFAGDSPGEAGPSQRPRVPRAVPAARTQASPVAMAPGSYPQTSRTGDAPSSPGTDPPPRPVPGLHVTEPLPPKASRPCRPSRLRPVRKREGPPNGPG